MATDWLGLAGKNAVVTGAGGGIGRSIALELARVGTRVLVLDLNEDGARETVDRIEKETGVAAMYRGCDTTDADQVAASAAAVREAFGSVDVLVNNAGVVGDGSLTDVPVREWQRVLDINLTGYLLCAREFGADMVEHGSGSIVHVSSICGLNPYPQAGAYSPSKAAVTMMSRQLATEWAATGVRSNAVAPGLIRTPLTEASYTDARTKAAREDIVPMGHIGLPQDIANAVLWFASARSGYVTGQQVVVDGGLDQALLGMVRTAGVDG